MFTYLIRKFFLTLSIIFGVMLLTFLLFNVAAKDPVRAFGGKQMKESDRIRVTHELGLDKPRFVPNVLEYHSTGHVGSLLDTQFFNILSFHFPRSQRYQESVWSLFAQSADIACRAGSGVRDRPGVADHYRDDRCRPAKLFDRSRRNFSRRADDEHSDTEHLSRRAMAFCAQLRWFPVAGWAPGILLGIHFAALPILITVIGGLGGSVRFYRTVALEEINTDYVRTARAKGVSGSDILLVHVFRNLLIPVVTNTIVALPFLLTGTLLLEQMFQIPGFGGLLVDSIHATDSPVVMAEMYLTAIAYAVMLFITDICYTLVDPRVVLR